MLLPPTGPEGEDIDGYSVQEIQLTASKLAQNFELYSSESLCHLLLDPRQSKSGEIIYRTGE